MSKTVHTAGNWVCRPSYHDGKPQGYVVLAGPGRKVIADLCSSPEDLSVEHANALLITAAPDLLEACKAMLSLDTERSIGEVPRQRWERIRELCSEAISKAGGAQ